MNKFTFLEAYCSPFKRPMLRLYVGKVAIGVPYFFPRYTFKSKTRKGWLEFKTRRFGFDFVDLGWKTKWSDTDYRFEHSPVWSFVLLNFQVALMFVPEHKEWYWQAWLYYKYNTKGTTNERVAQCRAEYPLMVTSYPDETTTDYYTLILKDKWQRD